MWSFGNGFSKNVVIFGVDNTSSSHPDNEIKKFLVLGEGPIEGINDNVGAAEKNFVLTLAKTKFCSSLHYSGVNSYF